jgi:hypothetical protein
MLPGDAFDKYLREGSPYKSGKQDLAHLEQFHLDYIDSDVANAHAFGNESCSFLGLTMGLIFQLGNLCVRLSRSETVTTLLGIELTPDVRDGLHATVACRSPGLNCFLEKIRRTGTKSGSYLLTREDK